MKKQIVLHTDGACNPNPGFGGWAILFEGKNNYLELCGSEPDTTNNRMEMRAAIEGLKSLDGNWQVTIRTDSMYLIYAIRRKGTKRKTKSNVELTKELWAAMEPHDVCTEYVRGHCGDPFNERADYLAESCASVAKKKGTP